METTIDEVQVWDNWNSKHRQGRLDEPSKRRMREILASVADLKIQGAKILEVGCGTGWLSSKLCEFGKVTAVDLGMEIIETAKVRYPEIDFRSGDIHTLDLPLNSSRDCHLGNLLSGSRSARFCAKVVSTSQAGRIIASHHSK